MLFTRLMGMISLGIGLSLFALYWFAYPHIPHHDPLDLNCWLFDIAKSFPPIGVGLDLIFRKSPAPAVQTAVRHEELSEAEPDVWIDFETSPGDSRC